MRVAVLVDAAFFLKRYKALIANADTHTGQQVAGALHQWACEHSSFDAHGRRITRKHFGNWQTGAELYRIFVYDCPPFMGKLHHPVTKRLVDFGQTDLAKFRSAFLKRLPQLRKVALRLGHLSEVPAWKIKPSVMEAIVKGQQAPTPLGPDDVVLDVAQKGVDMRIGVDVASLAYKRLVDRIVLVAGDADFIPAAKMARREGIDFVLDSMHAHINNSLYEHIDGLASMAPPPGRPNNGNQPAKDYPLLWAYQIPNVTYGAIPGPNFGTPTAVQSPPQAQSQQTPPAPVAAPANPGTP